MAPTSYLEREQIACATLNSFKTDNAETRGKKMQVKIEPAFWESLERTARRVADWPDWKTGTCISDRREHRSTKQVIRGRPTDDQIQSLR
jgi:hypothetical protein